VIAPTEFERWFKENPEACARGMYAEAQSLHRELERALAARQKHEGLPIFAA